MVSSEGCRSHTTVAKADGPHLYLPTDLHRTTTMLTCPVSWTTWTTCSERLSTPSAYDCRIGEDFHIVLAPFLHGQRYSSFGRHVSNLQLLRNICNVLEHFMRASDVRTCSCLFVVVLTAISVTVAAVSLQSARLLMLCLQSLLYRCCVATCSADPRRCACIIAGHRGLLVRRERVGSHDEGTCCLILDCVEWLSQR